MPSASANYLTPVLAEHLTLLPVGVFKASPPSVGFGHAYKDGWIDSEYEIGRGAHEDIPLDATHVVWFESTRQAEDAYEAGWIDPYSHRQGS